MNITTANKDKKIGRVFWDYAFTVFTITRYFDATGASYVDYEIDGNYFTADNTQAAKRDIKFYFAA